MTREEQLVATSRKLVAAARLAANMLGEGDEFQSLLRAPAEAVNAVLEQYPAGMDDWDGRLLDEDIISTPFRGPLQGSFEDPTAAKVEHRVTGLSTESYSKHSYPENYQVARRALEKRVRQEFERINTA